MYRDNSLALSKSSKGGLFKNLTVFFVSQEGNILIKCKGCGKVTEAPFVMFKSEQKNSLMKL